MPADDPATPDAAALVAAALARHAAALDAYAAGAWRTPAIGASLADVPALTARLAEAEALLGEVVDDSLAGIRPEPGFLTKYECVYCTWSMWGEWAAIPVPVPHDADCLITRIAAHTRAAADGAV